MNTCIIENPPANNLPALLQPDQRPVPVALALAFVARRCRIRGAVATVIIEQAGIGREARQ